ncbi:MAG TPA: fructose-6-phosphate aldolase [Candidatus Limnocylindrales bacterium]|nr:fructose-6-phosphate aldolase [Candidatus Limnocylindrales bacterium]
MEIYLDTANLKEIQEVAALGIISGITTNPTLVAKEGKGVNFETRIKEIAEIIPGPISAEVVSTEATGMLREAYAMAKWSSQVVIKIPMIPEGLKAVKILSQDGIKTNMTLIFSTNQALLAARAGATYVSSFIGRMDDISHDGMRVIREIREVWNRHSIQARIIAASIRHPIHLVEAARAGAHIATVPYKILMQALKHPLTDIGLERFLADWKSLTS